MELTAEREAHILERHPDLLPRYRSLIAETLANPDEVRRSRKQADARMLYRRYKKVRGGKFVVTVVVTPPGAQRNWVITAYITGQPASGELEWKRP